MALIDPQKAQFFTKPIGSLALVKPLIRRMGIAELIDRLCPADPQQLVSHGRVVELLVANRLVAPTPLYAVEDWARGAGVEELYGLPADGLNDDRLGESLGHRGPPPTGAQGGDRPPRRPALSDRAGAPALGPHLGPFRGGL